MADELSVQNYSLSKRFSALNGVPPLGMHEPQQAARFAGWGLQDNTKPQFRGRVSGPIISLLKIFARWDIGDEDAAKLLGKETAQFVADLRAGTSGLEGRDTQDRARLLLNIYEAVHSLLRDDAEEKSWLRSPMPALGGRSLFAIMQNGSFADLLLARSFVDQANGR